MNDRKKTVRNAGIYGVLLLVAYSVPINTAVTLNEVFVLGLRGDYILHFLLFFPIPILIRRSFRTKALALTLLLIMGALLVESTHLFIPERSFNLKDALANATGIVAGIVLVYTVRKPLEENR